MSTIPDVVGYGPADETPRLFDSDHGILEDMITGILDNVQTILSH